MDLTPFQPLKLLRYGHEVEAMLRGDLVYPISVELDLSNTCPHDCPMCSFGTSESQGYRQQNWVQFPAPRMLRLLEELAECGVRSVTFTGGGEPLIHRSAAALLEQAQAVGLAYGVVTNGVLLRGAVAEQIARHATFVRVSLDAGSAETHQITHRTSKLELHLILDQMQHVRAKADAFGHALTIGASFCVQRVNYRELYQAGQLVKEHGGDYLEVRPTFPTDWRGDGWNDQLTEEEVEQARAELIHAQTHLNDGRFKVIGMIPRFEALPATYRKPYAQCRIGPLMTVIGADQALYHCCVQRGQAAFHLGSLADRSFAEAWAEAQARQMHTQIDVTRCPRCRYDGFNTIVQDVFTRDALHAKFL